MSVPTAYIGYEWYLVMFLVVVIALGIIRAVLTVRIGRQRVPASPFYTPAKLDFTAAKCPACGQGLPEARNNCPKCGWHLGNADLPAATQGLTMGIVQRDIYIDSMLAFHQGQVVSVEGEASQAGNAANRYIVKSDALQKKYLLSVRDVVF